MKWSELAKAIRFVDGAASFLLDSEVILTVDTCVRQALVSRGFGWPLSLRGLTLERGAADVLSSEELKALSEMHAFNMRDDISYEYGFGYYVALLALRKQFGTIIRDRVRKEHDRDCRAGEMEEIAHHYGGLRARRLAEHGDRHQQDPLLFLPDELLVYGAIYGVVEGTDVVLVTRDPVFMDQFVKLMTFLGNDYVASQYGRTHVNDRAAFPEFRESADPKNPVTAAFGRAIAGKVRHGWQQVILPHSPYPINLHCWLLGRGDDECVPLAALTFCAERGMHNLLRVKGETGGQNVTGIEGRNLRAALGGSLDEKLSVTIWQDRMVPIGAAGFPSDDRLDLRIESIAAPDISLTHSNVAMPASPWFETTY